MGLIEIVAADRQWAIGRDGGMCHHLPADMAFFKQTTMGGVLILGRKTLDSFPGGRPLPGRVNIVITRQKDFYREGCIIVHSPQEALQRAKEYVPRPAFVVGGGEIYRQMLPWCTKAYVTKIDTIFDQPDTFVDDLDARPEWQVSAVSEKKEYSGITFQFVTYERQ